MYGFDGIQKGNYFGGVEMRIRKLKNGKVTGKIIRVEETGW